MVQKSKYPSSSTLPHYVGVTGVQSAADATSLITRASSYKIGPSHSHVLMLGCLVSSGINRDTAPTQTAKPCRHVANRHVLREILSTTEDIGGLGMLHFELHKSWPGTRGDAKEVIALTSDLARHGLQPPIQLNGVLLESDVNEIVKESGCRVVLQFRKEFSEQSERSLLTYIEAVAPAVSMILLDPSAGTGHSIDLAPALQTRALLESNFPQQFTYGFAGGLGGISDKEKAHTTRIVQELTVALGSTAFSIDTETRVRAVHPELNTDTLDLERCETYFASVTAGLSAS